MGSIRNTRKRPTIFSLSGDFIYREFTVSTIYWPAALITHMLFDLPDFLWYSPIIIHGPVFTNNLTKPAPSVKFKGMDTL